MWQVPDWPKESQAWDDNCLSLLLSGDVTEITDLNLSQIIEKSNKFPIDFPVQTILCKNLSNSVSEDVLNRNINSVYPVIHEQALYLCAQFLLYKKTKGSSKEKIFYADMSLMDLIERLLIKKAVVFLNSYDSYLLLNKQRGAGGWELIGTDQETEKLNLSKCLSYDELKLGALLSISSYTCFINDGNRMNCGKYQRENVEDEGIIVGLIGTRLEKEKVMEYQDILITEEQNTNANGFGVKDSFKSLLAKFYEEDFLEYNEVEEKAKMNKMRYREEGSVYFDNTMYAKRLALSFDTFLLEANARAGEVNKFAYVHVVGIGLGVWRAFDHQKGLFLDIFINRIRSLGDKLLHTSDVFFDYFAENSVVEGFKSNDQIPIANHPRGGIVVYFGKRNPHQKLTEQHEGKLLVVSYAADANSLPGNEFWHGSLDGSGDPAAASSTQIAELHNPFINEKISGRNVRIATLDGVFNIKEYRQRIVSSRKLSSDKN